MNYIFCPCYPHLYFVLHLWYKNPKDITILTHDLGIKQFCDFLGIKIFYFVLPALPTKNVFRQFYLLYILKKNIDSIIKELDIKKEDKFYLLGNIISYTGFYLNKLFSKKCETYYKLMDIRFSDPKEIKKCFNRKYLMVQYLQISIRIVFDINLVVYYTGIKYVVGIVDKNFLEKCHVNKMDFNKNLHQLREEAMQKIGKIADIDCDTMVTDEYERFLDSILSRRSLKAVYQNLFNILSNYAIKEHPYFLRSTSVPSKSHLPKNVQKFPVYIPSELLFKNVKKNVVGFVSSTLVSAANFTNLKAISFLELVEWKEEKYKKHYKDFLIKQSSRIIFVRDFEELEALISQK